jgi:hypothetical protein
MKKLLIAALLVFVPFIGQASDDVLRASIVSKLLAQFVDQVNLIDELQLMILDAENPAEFQEFKDLVTKQLAFTTSQIASILSSDNVAPIGEPVYIPNPVYEPVGSPTVEQPDLSEMIVKVHAIGEGWDDVLGEYSYNVWVKGNDGEYLQEAITFHLPENDRDYVKRNGTWTRTPNGITSAALQDWNTNFSYLPTSAGTFNLRFTSGSQEQIISVVVDN